MADIPVPPKVIPVSVAGAPINAHDGQEGEVMMDIEVAAGICPKANTVVYFPPNSDAGLIELLDHAIHDQQNDPGVQEQ